MMMEKVLHICCIVPKFFITKAANKVRSMRHRLADKKKQAISIKEERGIDPDAKCQRRRETGTDDANGIII